VDNVAAGQWKVTANLTAWAADIASGKIKRVELAVRPNLKNAAGDLFALSAVSKTFDLGTKKVVNFYPDIALVPSCNNCHDQLGTTFHNTSALDRGGSIVVCRMCHVPGRGGSHVEMASRSIDSYAHAIHSFQAFDFDTVNFDNAVQSMFYDLKVESTFPTFGLTNCVACHKAGMFNVPDQSKSLPGIFSPSDTNDTSDRNIMNVPYYISGPASRACGGCHRAELIKEDAAVELASFNSHNRANGYLLETTSSTYAADYQVVISTIMAYFEEGVVLPTP
jgi:OmcA/MtrC family decaheme c-type cytochrome